ncbi:hypothetical protein HK105_203551 [Polyrhizophydium stewartii]|uniref:Ankyrin repeat protein n=1 Tax=Polyrhizophydium stewartii TaxID=2732419 RepID=A0ABR4NBA7_9FUNG
MFAGPSQVETDAARPNLVATGTRVVLSASPEPLDDWTLPGSRPQSAPPVLARPSERFAGCTDLATMIARLPHELRLHILELAGPLTQLLHGTLRRPFDPQSVSMLWADCFHLDVVHAVPRLPQTRLTWELLLVRSPAMLAAVAARRLPLAADAPTGLSVGAALSSSPARVSALVEGATRSCAGAAMLMSQLDSRGQGTESAEAARLMLIASAGAGSLRTVTTLLAAHASAIEPRFICRAIDTASHGHLRVVLALIAALDGVNDIAPEDLPSISVAVRDGHLAIAQAICTRFPDAVASCPVDDAVQLARNDILVWLFEHTRLAEHWRCRNIQTQCIWHGNLPILMLAFRRNIGLPPRPATIGVAAEYGHLELLKWIHRNMPDIAWCPNAIDKAAFSGKIEVVRWIHENRHGLASKSALDWAASNGHMDIIWFLHENRTEGCTTDAMDKAAAAGHLDVIRFLHENRMEGCTTKAMDWAAMNGHLEVVRYLHYNRTEGCTTDAMDWAAASGHLRVVHFLNSMRTEGCTTNALDWAASNNHIDVVVYLFDHRTEGYTSSAIVSAASKGHLAVVQLLCEHGCCDNTLDAIDQAAANGHLQVVKYLLRSHFPFTMQAYARAASNGHFEIIRTLFENNPHADWSSASVCAAKAGHRDIVEWIGERVRSAPPPTAGIAPKQRRAFGFGRRWSLTTPRGTV